MIIRRSARTLLSGGLLACAALGAGAARAAAQSPDFTAILAVRPNPSPYIADWQSDPSIVTLVLSYTGTADVAFYLTGRIMHGSARVLAGTSAEFEFPRPSQLLLTTKDGIWDPNSVTYQSALRDQLERTGRIPDGDYEFCVDAHAGLPESGGGAILASACAAFTIVAPLPPSLISPYDGDTVGAGLPTFVWTPVMAGFNVSVAYHVRITEILAGQSPLDAINNTPQYEADLTTTSLLYPPTALALRDSARYVWQVQALDGAGQSLGERDGKSEAWVFTYLPAATTAFAGDTVTADTTSSEPAAGSFMWGTLKVKVITLADSSRNNYTGRGRVVLIPGVLEPSFHFEGVHLDSSRTQVTAAPTHIISLPIGSSTVDWFSDNLPAPLYLNVRKLVLVADSANNEHYAGLSGSGTIFLGIGVTDSLANPLPDTTKKSNCAADSSAAAADTSPKRTVCEKADDAAASPSALARLAAADKAMSALEAHSMIFVFDSVGLDAKGAVGTVTLARDFKSGVFGWSGAKLTLLADSTALHMANGGATLDIEGTLQLPGTSGLIRDRPDTAWKADTARPGKKVVDKIDSTVTIAFKKVQLGTGGEVYIAAAGLPRSHVGKTGLHVQTGNAWIDFSSKLSPPGKAAGWEGVYFDSARVDLPEHWRKQDKNDSTASIVGYQLAVDGQGFSGNIFGSRLQRLGPVAFGGFSGQLDSLHFRFTTGTLDTGYVAGSVTMPFLTGAVPYWVDFTPAGVDRAYAKLTAAQTIPIPALHATAVIQRGAFTYVRPIGTFTMDAKLSIDQDGVALKDAQVYGLAVTSDGRLTLGGGWLAFDNGNEADFKHFPVALDSIGFGSGSSGNEAWVGFAGRFALNDNLPAAAGAFRLFAARKAPGESWGFEKIAVDKLDLAFTNAAVSFKGGLDYFQDDSVYGTGFKANVNMNVVSEFSVGGTVRIGATDPTASTPSFRYWYVDASLLLPPPGIQLGQIPLSLYGFGGGAYVHMKATLDSVTLARTYVPDAATAFGLKAHVTLGTSLNQGYVWNADGELAAEVGTSGGLSALTFRADNWMLTNVSERAHKIWGTVQADLPVSQPVLQANLNLNVDMRPAVRGAGWAELHFAPTKWYVHLGTDQRPDSLTLLPGAFDLRSTSYFMMDGTGIDAGFATHLYAHKSLGDFSGTVDAGFEATAAMRYRPFTANGSGELWGDIEAKYKSWTIFQGTARATMNFTLPDPTRIWGKVSFKYNLANGLYHGTYAMKYSWGSAGSEASDTAMTLVASTYPVDGDTAAPVTGVSFYLAMSEGEQYGLEDGYYKLRLIGTPSIDTVCVPTGRNNCGASGLSPTPARSGASWASIGTVSSRFSDDRQALTLAGPGFATLAPGRKYRAAAEFELDKWENNAWTPIQTKTTLVTFTTAAETPTVGQLVSGTDPAGGAAPLYYGGPNKGAVRVQFTNVVPEVATGSVVPLLVANGTDTVPGSWAMSHYFTVSQGMPGGGNDPTLYAFTPSAGALSPSTTYRFALVRNDTTHDEAYGVSFVTSRYASLAEHVAASTVTVTPTRGAGPVSGTGTHLLGVVVKLGGSEPIAWQDIDSIAVTGVDAAWQVIPSTQCEWINGQTPPPIIGLGGTTATLCSQPTVYDNVLAVTFSAADDASLPAATTPSITIRLNHRREGWQTFTFAIPQPIVATPPGGITTPPPPPPPPPPTVDVTKSPKITKTGGP